MRFEVNSDGSPTPYEIVIETLAVRVMDYVAIHYLWRVLVQAHQKVEINMMAGDFAFRNLIPEVRQHMLAEIELDTADDVLVTSKRFNNEGVIRYPPLLRTAASDYNEAWLAESLIGSFNATELSAGKEKQVPRNAHIVFAQCEFNRFYCRALCLYVLANPNYSVRVYRARQSETPRPESEAKIGQTIDPATVLKDLREHLATDVEFGPNEIGSGLSLELVLNGNSV